MIVFIVTVKYDRLIYQHDNISTKDIACIIHNSQFTEIPIHAA